MRLVTARAVIVTLAKRIIVAIAEILRLPTERLCLVVQLQSGKVARIWEILA